MNIGAGCHPNKVKVSGPGVAKTGLKAFEPTYFTVDCSEAGQGITVNTHDLFDSSSFVLNILKMQDLSLFR